MLSTPQVYKSHGAIADITSRTTIVGHTDAGPLARVLGEHISLASEVVLSVVAKCEAGAHIVTSHITPIEGGADHSRHGLYYEKGAYENCAFLMNAADAQRIIDYARGLPPHARLAIRYVVDEVGGTRGVLKVFCVAAGSVEVRVEDLHLVGGYMPRALSLYPRYAIPVAPLRAALQRIKGDVVALAELSGNDLKIGSAEPIEIEDWDDNGPHGEFVSSLNATDASALLAWLDRDTTSARYAGISLHRSRLLLHVACGSLEVGTYVQR